MSGSFTEQLPRQLVPGRITAWRAWRLEGSRLYGIGSGSRFQVWPAARPLRAICAQNIDHREVDAPDPRCQCGVWALRTADAAVQRMLDLDHHADRLRRAAIVVGAVQLWGRVIDHEDGWRAEYARPVSLLQLWNQDPDTIEFAQQAAVEYGIAVEPTGWRERIRSWQCPCPWCSAVRDLEKAAARIFSEHSTGTIHQVWVDELQGDAFEKFRQHLARPRPAPWYRRFERRSRRRPGRG